MGLAAVVIAYVPSHISLVWIVASRRQRERDLLERVCICLVTHEALNTTDTWSRMRSRTNQLLIAYAIGIGGSMLCFHLCRSLLLGRSPHSRQ